MRRTTPSSQDARAQNAREQDARAAARHYFAHSRSGHAPDTTRGTDHHDEAADSQDLTPDLAPDLAHGGAGAWANRQRVTPERRRGRGVVINPSGRFEKLTREDIDDGWNSLDDLPPFRTEVTVEKPRTIITRNASPDISFDRSINAYRGCEHVMSGDDQPRTTAESDTESIFA